MAKGLEYPLAARPAPGEALPVADGVHWVRMPMPGGLDHINLWLLEDGEGWTIVDTGLNLDESKGHWERIFDRVLGGRPVTRIIVTHFHPDHLGLAGWLVERWRAPLWMTRTEFLTSKAMLADQGNGLFDVGLDFFRRAGFTEDQLAAFRERGRGRSGHGISPLPPSYRRIVDREILSIGAHKWEVVIGRGHAPEHASLYCPELNILLSGDQVLPRITSNVSVQPAEPEGDPLREWLESHADMRARLPADAFVLPAHNDPFLGLHRRLNALIEVHESRLASLYRLCDVPRRVVDTFETLFDRPIEGWSIYPATGEAIAHLNCLIARGKIVREENEDGVSRYRRLEEAEEAEIDAVEV